MPASRDPLTGAEIYLLVAKALVGFMDATGRVGTPEEVERARVLGDEALSLYRGECR